MTEREALHEDFEYSWDGPDPGADTTAAAPTYRRPELFEETTEPGGADPFPPATVRAQPPITPWRYQLGRPWYRRKPAAIAAAAAAAVLAVGGGVLALLGPAGSPDTPTGITPSTSIQSPDLAPPATSGPPSTRASTPAPPPPPPPPPPPETNSPVVPRQNWPRQYPSSQAPEPEIGVTRTPVTRAPISVAPKPVTPPKTATPGDGGGGGGWGF